MKIFENLCRSCLLEPENALPFNCLVSMEDSTETLQSMYELLTHLKIKTNDNLPQQMCKECVNKLNSSFRFLKQCLESDEFLQNGTIEFVEESDPTLDDKMKIILDVEQETYEDGILEEDRTIIDDCDDSNISIKHEDIEIINMDCLDDSNLESKTFEESFEKSLNASVTTRSEILLIEQPDSGDEIEYEIEKSDTEILETDDEAKVTRKRVGGEQLLCNICGEAFKTTKRYNVHLEQHEIQQKLKDSGQDPNNIKCELCDRTFSKIDAYIRHQKIHNPDNPNVCDICGKAFLSPSLLKVHRLRHIGMKPFSCRYCSKGFTTKFDLEVHTRFHTGERPYKCKYCEKSYVSQSHRSEHMRSKHIEANAGIVYECEVCGQHFKTKRTLQTHMKRHKDLQIKCRLCDLTFPTSKLVLNHLRTHPEYEPLSCEFCGKTFREQHHLESHSKLHIL